MKSYAVCIDTSDVSQTGKYTTYLLHALEMNGISVISLTRENTGLATSVDTVIIGSRIPSAAEMDSIRTHARRVVYLMASDPIVEDIERFSYATSIPTERADCIRSCDTIWLTDNFQNHRSYVEAIYKRPVTVIPNLWDSSFTSSIRTTYSGKVNGGPLHIIILESNTSFNTSGWKQLVICEQLYLRNPKLIDTIYVLNTPDSNTTSMGMIQSLQLKKDGKVRIFKSLPIADIVNFFLTLPNVVFLCNQTFDDLSYNYYDVLNAGYNVVHSSKLLKDANVGSYYDSLDIEGAIQQLLRTDHTVDAAVINSRTFLRSLRLSSTSVFE